VQLLRHLATLLAVGIATYFILVFAALLAAGGAVSCTNNCTDVAQFLNDPYPWPMIGGIAVAAATAALTLRRLRH
jgi:hypothetical protein